MMAKLSDSVARGPEVHRPEAKAADFEAGAAEAGIFIGNLPGVLRASGAARPIVEQCGRPSLLEPRADEIDSTVSGRGGWRVNRRRGRRARQPHAG